MDLPIYYCKSWFRMKKVAIELLTETDAGLRHSSGESYTVLIGSESKPSCFVEVLLGKGMVGVGFLDDRCREYLTYQFQCVSTDRLFLSMATHREFCGDEERILGGTSYIFSESGDLIIRREKFNPHSLEEAKSSFDPSGNYEDVPDFGCYSSLIKADR
jgi:hypothetical protein